MKRVTLASALTIAGVLSAGATAALVNTRVLESVGGDATGTNRVALEEARDTGSSWSRLPPRLPTRRPAPPVTALGGASGVFTDDVPSVDPTTSTVDEDTRSAPPSPTTGHTPQGPTRTSPRATTTTSEPLASTVPTTTSTTAPGTTTSPPRPSPSTTTTTVAPDDSRGEHLDWSHWFPGASTTTTVPQASDPLPAPPTTAPRPTGADATTPTEPPAPTTVPEPEDPPATTSTTFPPDD